MVHRSTKRGGQESLRRKRTYVGDAGDVLGLAEGGADLLPVLRREALLLELVGEGEDLGVELLADEPRGVRALSAVGNAIVCTR